MPSYPYTIENGHGERLTFLRRAHTPEGEIIEGENFVQPGSGPPMHVHYRQEERFTVVTGRMAYQVKGEEVRYAGPGETATFPPGVFHRFWNAGEDVLHCRGTITPPENFEYFLTHIFASQKKTGRLRPDPFDAAFLLTRYGSEFGMEQIPPVVRRFVFPVQVAVGHALGKYRKFADAPAPMVG